MLRPIHLQELLSPDGPDRPPSAAPIPDFQNDYDTLFARIGQRTFTPDSIAATGDDDYLALEIICH